MTEWGLRLLGAFYAFAGVVVLRQLASDRLIQMVHAALNGGVRPNDAIRAAWLAAGGVFTLLCGLALAGLNAIAPALMLVNVAMQGGWLLYAARAFPPQDEEDAKGRRQTINAFLLFLGFTVLVIWLVRTGRVVLFPDEMAARIIGLAAIALASWQGWHVWRFSKGQWPDGERSPTLDAPEEPVDPPVFDPPQRVMLSPRLGCWPLWDMDTGRNVSVDSIDLPADLSRDISAFEDAVIGAIDVDHAEGPILTDKAQIAALEAQATALTLRLGEVYGADNVSWMLPDGADFPYGF